MRNHLKIVSILLTIISLVAGCATDPRARQVRPAFMDSAFKPEAVDKLVVLPVADLRRDLGVTLSAEKLDHMVFSPYPAIFSNPNAWRFEHRGYKEVVFLNKGQTRPTVSGDHLSEMKEDWIRSLGRDSDRWVLVVTLDDLSSANTFGSVVKASCSAYLVDKRSAKLAWRHSASVEVGFGGLAGLMGKGMLESGLPADCASKLYWELPYRG